MKNRFYISFGVWIALIPHLGVPSVWKTALFTTSGLFLILTSVLPMILEKLRNDAATKEVVKEVVKKRNYVRKPKLVAEVTPQIIAEEAEKIPEIQKEEIKEEIQEQQVIVEPLKNFVEPKEERRVRSRRRSLASKAVLHESR